MKYIAIFGSGFSGSSIISDWLNSYNQYTVPDGEEMKFLQHGVAGVFLSKIAKTDLTYFKSLYALIPDTKMCFQIIAENDASAKEKCIMLSSAILFYLRLLILKILKPKMTSYRQKLNLHFKTEDIIKLVSYTDIAFKLIKTKRIDDFYDQFEKMLKLLSDRNGNNIIVLDNAFTGNGVAFFQSYIMRAESNKIPSVFIYRDLRAQYLDILNSRAIIYFNPYGLVKRRRLYQQYHSNNRVIDPSNTHLMNFEEIITNPNILNDLEIALEGFFDIKQERENGSSFDLQNSRKNIMPTETKLTKLMANVITRLE